MTWPHLANPAWLTLLMLAPVLAWRHHRRPALGALTYSVLPRVTGAGAWRLHMPFYARLLAFALLIVALARPQLGYAWEESLTEGIDIEVVLDVSGSMGALDFKPTDRITYAKQVVHQFIDARPADRIGVVVFAGAAVNRVPLTTDKRMLDLLVDSVDLDSLPDGTAIGVALASGAARLKDSEAKSRVIVLVTDGVNNAGEIDPISAAAVCKGLGIRVYTIGVGTNGIVDVPLMVPNPMTGEREKRTVQMQVEVDEKLLAEIAGKTGGRTYRATDPTALGQAFAEIDRLEKTPIKVKRYVRYEESFQPLVWAALALLMLPLGTTLTGLTAEP
ncbi:MAG: VWA domain-containing protein [Acidobacteriota bacterium]